MRWLMLVAFAACGDVLPYDGPATAVVDFDGQGIVFSSPPGIDCGECTVIPQSGCGEHLVGTECSARFELGTTITLLISDQLVYYGMSCLTDDGRFDGVRPSCSVALTDATTTIRVMGYAD